MTVRANEEELLVRYLVIGDILQNLRWYHAVEMWQWCKPLLWLLSNPVCLVCASCLWNLNEVALVVFVVVADYIIELSTFMLLLLFCCVCGRFLVKKLTCSKSKSKKWTLQSGFILTWSTYIHSYHTFISWIVAKTSFVVDWPLSTLERYVFFHSIR